MHYFVHDPMNDRNVCLLQFLSECQVVYFQKQAMGWFVNKYQWTVMIGNATMAHRENLELIKNM